MGSLWAPRTTLTLPLVRHHLRCVYPSRRSALLYYRASTQSSNKDAWRQLSTVVACLSPASPGEDSPSTELGSKIDLKLPRRRLQLSFTCDACGARSQRLINPDAYARGTVFVQCAGCEVYHKLVDNLGLIEEYDFREEANKAVDEVDFNVVE